MSAVGRVTYPGEDGECWLRGWERLDNGDDEACGESLWARAMISPGNGFLGGLNFVSTFDTPHGLGSIPS